LKGLQSYKGGPAFRCNYFNFCNGFNSSSPLGICGKRSPCHSERSRGISSYSFSGEISSPLGIGRKQVKIVSMPAVATSPMIRREIGDDHICLLTFDRPDSGANIFDAATLDELNKHLDFVENDTSLRGLIIASAKKSIFIAGADLKTLLQQAQSGDMRAFIANGQQIFSRFADLKIPTVAA